MPKPRKALISLQDTPYYHCTSRCVRRAFLCGSDPLTGQDFDHRRQWILEKLQVLTGCFAIDCCAYALMSNHYHLVLHVDHEVATKWTLEEVIRRWQGLFKGSLLADRYLAGQKMSHAERVTLDALVSQWRDRLTDISWFMRCLNESVARRANQEDHCTGRFWEGRFKSQALLDEKALAACLVYVDLNPIRAKMAHTPEASDYTSIAARIESIGSGRHDSDDPKATSQPPHLLPFAGNPRQAMPKGLPFQLSDYLELVDWTGRILREDKRGAIPQDLPPILERLQIDPQHWCYMTCHFESRFKGLVGTAYALKQACQNLGFRRSPGMSACARLLS
ncbi:MAG: transposase [Candidatus Thiodiazotropha sp.]